MTWTDEARRASALARRGKKVVIPKQPTHKQMVGQLLKWKPENLFTAHYRAIVHKMGGPPWNPAQLKAIKTAFNKRWPEYHKKWPRMYPK